MILALPIEIKDREYLSKLLLAHKFLAQKKNIVLLSRSRLCLKYIKTIKNAIFLDKSLSVHKEKLSENIIRNNYLSVLDEEAPIYNWVSFMTYSRLPFEILKKTQIYFVRSESEKKIVEKRFNRKFNNIKVVGHPKFDLLKDPYIKLFQNDANNIKSTYNKFVFIPLSFIHDLKGNNQNYQSYLNNTFATSKKLKASYTKSVKQWDLDKKNYINFLQIIYELAKKNPEINFIIRPHPTQSLNKIKKRFKSLPHNIKIIYKYTITPWLKACDYYLHSHCSSVYEAAILKKKIICFNTLGKKGVNLKVNPGYKFKNRKQLLSFFSKLEKNKINYNFKKIIIHKKNLYNYSNKISSSKEIIKNYEKLVDKKKIDNQIFTEKSNLLSIITKKYLVKIKKKLFNQEDYFSSKYFEINKSEILNYLNNFSKLDKSGEKYKINYLDTDVVLITNKKYNNI